jgi:predicted transcriptional regulator
MKLSEIKGLLKASVIVGDEKLDITVRAGAGSDLMSDLLRGPKDGVVVLTGLNNLQVVRTSIVSGVAAVVLVRGKQPEQETIALAREHELPLLSTPFTMYTACGRLFRAGLRGVEQKTRE